MLCSYKSVHVHVVGMYDMIYVTSIWLVHERL
jgi:hypothetical protein